MARWKEGMAADYRDWQVGTAQLLAGTGLRDRERALALRICGGAVMPFLDAEYRTPLKPSRCVAALEAARQYDLPYHCERGCSLGARSCKLRPYERGSRSSRGAEICIVSTAPTIPSTNIEGLGESVRDADNRDPEDEG